MAVSVSGQADKILMAGFDGYPPGDARNDEMEKMLATFKKSCTEQCFMSVTPTSYKGLPTCSIYAL